MIETTTIHFTGMGLLLAAIAPCLIAFFLWLVGRSVPPAVAGEGIRAGIGGLLLVVLLICRPRLRFRSSTSGARPGRPRA